MITDTYFWGNSARAGGALKLAGIASLQNCTFKDNTSDDGEGPAVFNGKYISGVTACSFVDNTFNCGPGEFLDYQESNSMSVDLSCLPRHGRFSPYHGTVLSLGWLEIDSSFLNPFYTLMKVRI